VLLVSHLVFFRPRFGSSSRSTEKRGTPRPVAGSQPGAARKPKRHKRVSVEAVSPTTTSDVEKILNRCCRKNQKNHEKPVKMWENVRKCEKMWENVRKELLKIENAIPEWSLVTCTCLFSGSLRLYTLLVTPVMCERFLPSQRGVKMC